MRWVVSAFLGDENGATAIEYGLIAGLIAIVILTGLALVSDELAALFGRGVGSPAGVISEAADSL